MRGKRTVIREAAARPWRSSLVRGWRDLMAPLANRAGELLRERIDRLTAEDQTA